MANKSVTLHNDDNDNLYPNTTASLVYMTNGNTVESEITNIKEQNPNKGFYSTPSALYEVYQNNIQDPNTRAGWFVTIGSTDTIWVWDVEGNEWKNSFNKPSDVLSVNGKTGEVVLTGNDINATATVGVDSVTKSVDAHLTDLYTNKVDKSTTIAGVDLQDDITSNELYVGLGLGTAATHNVSTNGVEDNDSSIPTAAQIKTYVAENGGKIDSISAGGTALTIDANKNVDIPVAGNSIKGVVDVRAFFGNEVDAYGRLATVKASNQEIDEKTNNYKAIVPSNYTYAVSKTYLKGSEAPTTSTVAEFEGQLYLDTTNNNTYQCVAITTENNTTTYTWTQIIRNTDVAGANLGVVKLANSNYGIAKESDGQLRTVPANNTEISNKNYEYKPITTTHLDHAVKVGITTNTTTLTDVEKASAQNWLGVSRGIARLS